MSIILLIMALIPALVVAGLGIKYFNSNELKIPSIFFAVMIAIVFGVIFFYMARGIVTSDTELLNGEITNKRNEKVTCEHTYSCNCRTVRGSNGQSHQECDTCRRHSYDIDWILESNVGKKTVNRVDDQGVRTPSVWANVKIGDPASMPHRFNNWVKAADSSLYSKKPLLANFTSEQINSVPAYPDKVYPSMQANNRVLRYKEAKIDASDIVELNNELEHRLKKLGPSKQVDIILVFTDFSNPKDAELFEAVWDGGKKNDVIIVFGKTDESKYNFAKVISWSESEELKSTVRDTFLDKPNMKAKEFFDILEPIIVKNFERKRWSDFEYLKNEIAPPTWAIVFGIIMASLLGFLVLRFIASR